MSSDKRQPTAGAVAGLCGGVVEIVGRLPWSSNFTFLADVIEGGHTTRVVYKPEQGEQELWDFPPGIYKREVAAYALSDALGWPNIPQTIVRDDAPYGIGSLQRFVPSDFEQHYFTLFETGEHDDAFARISTFDIIANNTDRKAGHCLLGDDGKIYAIDNGLCFHTDPKLRTVIWEFQTQPIPDELLADIERVCRQLPTAVLKLLTADEQDALLERMRLLLEQPTFPVLESQRQYPWPIV